VLCPLSNGEILGVVSDFDGAVHLIDPLARSYLQRVDLTEPAVDLSCCGDYAIVSSGAFIRYPRGRPVVTQPLGLQDRPPLVVDLIQRLQVAQDDPDLPGSSANQCGIRPGTVLSATLAEQRVDQLSFDQGSGQLQSTGNSLDANAPIHLAVSPLGRCAVWVDNDNLIQLLDIDTLDAMPPVAVSPGLSMLDACMSNDFVLVRSAFPDRVEAYDYGRDCRVQDNHRWIVEVPAPALVQTPAVSSMACPGNLLFMTVDGGDTTPVGDEIIVRQQHTGRLITRFTGDGLNGPLGIAVLILPPTRPIPTLSAAMLALLAIVCLCWGGWLLRREARMRPNP